MLSDYLNLLFSLQPTAETNPSNHFCQGELESLLQLPQRSKNSGSSRVKQLDLTN